MTERTPLAVIAIGGNSLIKSKHHQDVANQWDAVRETVGHIARMVEMGWRVVITHGNGPQVGFILRRNELAAGEVHTTPLSLIVADQFVGFVNTNELNDTAVSELNLHLGGVHTHHHVLWYHIEELHPLARHGYPNVVIGGGVVVETVPIRPWMADRLTDEQVPSKQRLARTTGPAEHNKSDAVVEGF